MRAPPPAVQPPRGPRSIATWMLFASLLLGGSALAYVLPTHAVLRRMVAVRQGVDLNNLRVQGSLTLEREALRNLAGPLGLGTEGGSAQVDASITLQAPGRCRLDAGSVDPADSRRLSAVSAGGKRLASGPETPAIATGLDELCVFLAMSGSGTQSRATMDAHLRALGLQSANTSLARFGGQVAYVIGGEGEGASQLWVYKDSFQPARMRWTAKDQTRWDVWMVDFGSAAAGDLFPRVVEVHRNGERQLRFDALSSTRPAKLDPALFTAPARPAGR